MLPLLGGLRPTHPVKNRAVLRHLLAGSFWFVENDA
jgi:hypothetical protein